MTKSLGNDSRRPRELAGMMTTVSVRQACTFVNTHQIAYVRSECVTSRSKSDFSTSGLRPREMESPLAENETHERRNTFLGDNENGFRTRHDTSR